MQLYVNEKKIRRNRTLGRWMMFGGLGASLIAVAISFLAQAYIFYALILMLAAGLVSQIGTAIYNRFGRSPRMDEVIDFSLKGLDDRFAVFHYNAGVSHAVFGPFGALAIVPRLERGEITYEGGTWYQVPPKRRISIGSRRKKLSDIPSEAERETKKLRTFLQKKLPDREPIAVEALMLFMAEDAMVETGDSPILAAHRKKVKSILRNLERQKSLAENDLRHLGKLLTKTG
ncbi:MAG: hypothetical protein ACK2TX_05875 [Anaerolineales bacterium]|jgi:hypothetical protein